MHHTSRHPACHPSSGAPPSTGAHILSGNVFQPKALDELLPEWREDASCPIPAVPAIKDRFYYLTPGRALRMPTPPQMHNRGNFVISLSEAVRWLGARAEEAGVEIYPGFAGARLLTSAGGACVGVGTGDMGIGKDGGRKDSFAPGLDLRARVTLLAEGCRGSLTKVRAERIFFAPGCTQSHRLLCGQGPAPASAVAGHVTRCCT